MSLLGQRVEIACGIPMWIRVPTVSRHEESQMNNTHTMFLLPTGYGKDIACVLAGKASENVIRKVEKSLMKAAIKGKRRTRGISRKTSADLRS